MGKALGESDYIHEMGEGVKSFMESEFRYRGTKGYGREIRYSFSSSRLYPPVLSVQGFFAG